MTDENPHEEEPDDEQQPQFIALPIPPQIQQMFAAQQDHAQMHYDEATHSLYRMLDEVSVEHLKLFKLLLHNLGDAPQALGYWEGLISFKVAERAKTCLACGLNHDEQAAAMIEAERAAMAAEQPVASVEAVNLMQHQALMAEFHVAPVLDDQPYGKVYCTGIFPDERPCGMTHPDLADRMVKRPDECSGCFARAGQG